MPTVFATFPWPQFDASPSAARRDIVVESATQKRRSSVGATSSDHAAPDGAKSKSTTADYKDAARDGADPQKAVLSCDAIAKIDAVAAAARTVRLVRAEALRNLKGGLRVLYRTLEWTRSRLRARPSRAFCFAKFLSPFPQTAQVPGANPLKDAHAPLVAVRTTVSLHHFADAAVLAPWSSTGSGNWALRADYSTGRAAYGFSAKRDLLAQLPALNLEVAAKIERGEPVTAPGVPKNYPDAKKLVTADCIKPA